ncbi:MAG: LutB/LldF family L-lactate oxidation iron-sulfur protein [Chloroflexota bacterium]
MSKSQPEYIYFGKYSRHVPAGIPQAVRQATRRFATNRASVIGDLSQWEHLRESGSAIRLHTVEHLDHYLEQFEQAVQNQGGIVYWASTAGEAREIVLKIAKSHQVTLAVKAKSMATEEIGLNEALQSENIRVLETDLGEYIIQLAESGPSHIIVPAVHMKKEEIAALFSQKLGIEVPADPDRLTGVVRQILREQFLTATMGISGANFLVAETGTLVMVTNEGNGRMCTTLPDIHVAVVGIDKVVPNWESLSVLLKLLTRSATGQKLSSYVQFISGPRREEGEFGPKELHIILLDNGRSKILRDPVGRQVLKCIRCGACANACPVYQNVGGFAYGWFISGPVGAIFTPQILGSEVARELPYASTLCGACADVCPVKIPIPAILRHLRQQVAEGNETIPPAMPGYLRLMSVVASRVLSNSLLYRLGSRLLGVFNWFEDRGWLTRLPFPFNRWTRVRPLPRFSNDFRSWWSHQKLES